MDLLLIKVFIWAGSSLLPVPEAVQIKPLIQVTLTCFLMPESPSDILGKIFFPFANWISKCYPSYQFCRKPLTWLHISYSLGRYFIREGIGGDPSEVKYQSTAISLKKPFQTQVVCSIITLNHMPVHSTVISVCFPRTLLHTSPSETTFGNR